MPAVSVIIATFNRAQMLRCAIRSVLRQTFTDFELIVSGDACTDDSEQIVAAFADERVRWMNRAEHCGSQWGPNNDAIAAARGDSIAFLGHDDLWLPWHLETLVPLLEDFVHPLGVLIGPEGVRDVFAPPPVGEDYDTNFVAPSGWLVRKSVLQSLGGFRSHAVTSCGTDTDLLRRLWKAGHRIVHAPRLSVLKFPSVWWGAYRTDAALPQEWWLARDPNDVERELLTGAVLMLATTRPHANPRRAFALALRNGLRWLRNRVEGERGAIAALMRARFRRSLRDVRRRRGLPSSRA